MPKVIVFIPISRTEHLSRLFASLEALECDPQQTGLLTYVDGDTRLYEQVSALTATAKFPERLCVRRKFEIATHSLLARRQRIAAIKNESKALLPACDFIFGIEDDTIVPTHALSQLLDDYVSYPHAGFIEGVELGRWGLPYVGAWNTDDPYEPTNIESMLPFGDMRRRGTVTGTVQGRAGSSTIEEIDAGGFYCYLTKRENYMLADYKPFGRNDLGPDVEFGLFLRQQGFKNYIDWSINCEHRTRHGSPLSPLSTPISQVAMVKVGDYWEQKIK